MLRAQRMESEARQDAATGRVLDEEEVKEAFRLQPPFPDFALFSTFPGVHIGVHSRRSVASSLLNKQQRF